MLFSLRGTLPVLDLDGERIVDSTRIIETLERRYPEPPLYPEHAAERREALELEDFFDEEAGHELRRASASSAAILRTRRWVTSHSRNSQPADTRDATCIRGPPRGGS